MVDALDVNLVAEGIAALVAVLQSLVLVGRHVVVAIEIDVAADTDVFDADHLCHIVHVIDHVLDGGRLAILHEVADTGDAHHAPRLAAGTNDVVWLAARMSWVQSTRIGMRDEDWPLRRLERIE